jgi:hypothetical protein
LLIQKAKKENRLNHSLFCKKEVDLSKSEPQPYKLILKTELKSKAKLFRLIPLKSFVSGERFECSWLFRNVSNERFPGTASRRVPIEIICPSGQIVNTSFLIPPLGENEIWATPKLASEALCEGFGLIFIRWRTPFVEDRKGKQRGVLFYRSKHSLKQNDNIRISESISSIKAKSREEIYEFWAMIISAIGLGIIALEKVFSFISQLITS